MKNKEGIWTSPTDVTWETKEKKNAGDDYTFLLSITKNPVEKDNKNATNNSKEQVLVEEAVENFKKGLENDSYGSGDNVNWHWLGEGEFWLNWNETDGVNTVVPGQKQQRWRQKERPNSGDYFTLEITDAGEFLTAVNGSLQIRGTDRFSSSIFYVKNNLFRDLIF